VVRDMRVQMEHSGAGVAFLFRVNMQEGRLEESPEKACSTQNCADYPHVNYTIYHQL
jgi:hypothetical protein